MYRFQRIVLIIYLLCFSFPLFSENIPSWLKNLDQEYPNSEYIKALGEGSSEKKAKITAIADVSLLFHSKVKVYNNVISDLQRTNENNTSSFTKKENFHQNFESVSEVDFYCLNFTDSFYDKKNKKYYIVAYINRNEAFRFYEVKMIPLISEFDAIVRGINEEEEPLFKTYLYHRAFLICELLQSYISNAIILKPSSAITYDDLLKRLSSIINEKRIQMNRIAFSITCNNPRGDALITGVASILENSGFVYSQKVAMYSIGIDLSFTEETYEAGEFVRPTMNITISNSKGNVVESYSKIYPRYSHGTLENSYSLSILRILQDLDENFLSDYREIQVE